ncbi:YbjQ family protein [Hyphomonas sp. WL0036]|uniref:YbjQ family protein n=1 Tax=Hyphomonas sediminis TaxID=2866160 RepID=UPI001C7FC00B|nr:YbjQ family protein [Hyphomonas sediminis]MBY9067318.1 YbjQ family protein [Hyphomonas sediminis]
MILTTTHSIQGRDVSAYKGIVCGEVVIGAHLGKDILAGFTNLVGGRSEAYESTLRETRDGAMEEMVDEAKKLGANAIIGIKFDYSVIGQGGSMMMVAVSGTAVTLA